MHKLVVGGLVIGFWLRKTGYAQQCLERKRPTIIVDRSRSMLQDNKENNEKKSEYVLKRYLDTLFVPEI